MSNILEKIYVKVLLLIVAGIISVFAFAPFNKILCIVVTILFVLLVLENSINLSKRKYFLLGYIFGLAYFNTQLYWAFYSLYVVIGTGFVVALLGQVLFTAYLALFFGFIVLFYCKLKTKHRIFNLLVIFPSVWVLFEWLRSWLFTGFPWNEIGYSQVNSAILRGWFPLLGNYAVSWITLSLCGAFFIILQQIIKSSNISSKSKKTTKIEFITKFSSKNKLLRFNIIYILLFFVVGNYISSIQYTQPYGKPVTVALLQGNIGEGVKWSDSNLENNLLIYASMIAKAKADIVMIPETAISQFAEYLPKDYLNDLINLAKGNNASLVVGMPKIIDSKNNYVNAAIVLTDDKQPFYAKSHLVPYGEYIPFRTVIGGLYTTFHLPMVGFSAGSTNQKPLVIAGQKFAFNICYENGFNSELIGLARNSTIMANISDMVWYGDSIAEDQHLQISQARALENQRYFVQDTNTGLTAIINPFGEIQSQLPTFRREVLNDAIQGRIGTTPFQIYGNYPIIIWCIFMILVSIVMRRFITYIAF